MKHYELGESSRKRKGNNNEMKKIYEIIAINIIKLGCALLNGEDGWRYTFTAGEQEYVLKKYQPMHEKKRNDWSPSWASIEYSALKFDSDEYSITLSDITDKTIQL